MPLIDTLFPMGIAQYLIGGLVIGLAVSFLFVSTGLIGGMRLGSCVVRTASKAGCRQIVVK